MSRPSYLVGLIGSGIQASRTPAMHEREGDEQGLRYLYQKIDLDQLGLGPEALPDLLLAAERMGFAGLNITHPCKQLVIPLLDELSPDARALGAVNTVVLRGGKRRGENTDWWGFAEAFRRNMQGVALDHVVQLGAGGAGAAVAHALLTCGVGQLALHDMDPARAEGLAQSLNARRAALGTVERAQPHVAQLCANELFRPLHRRLKLLVLLDDRHPCDGFGRGVVLP